MLEGVFVSYDPVANEVESLSKEPVVMKLLACMLVFASYPCWAIAEEHKVIAVSDWSESVVSHDRSLRARVLVLEGRSRAYAGPDAEVLIYMEIENTNSAWGKPLRVYFDAARGLSFQVLDDKDKPISPTPTFGSGGDVGALWATIPYDSSVRLRANPGGWGRGKTTDLVLPLRPMQGQYWQLPPDKDYYLTGSLKISPPTKDTFEHVDDWRGELKFPKTKIVAKKADDFPRLGMQDAIESAEAYAKQNKLDLSNYYLASMQLIALPNAIDLHAWQIVWDRNRKATDDEVEIIVKMDKTVTRRNRG